MGNKAGRKRNTRQSLTVKKAGAKQRNNSGAGVALTRATVAIGFEQRRIPRINRRIYLQPVTCPTSTVVWTTATDKYVRLADWLDTAQFGEARPLQLLHPSHPI